MRDYRRPSGLHRTLWERLHPLAGEWLGKMTRLQTVMEIADILGVTPQRASTIVATRGFPKPVDARVKAGCGIGAMSQRGRRSGGARSLGGELLR